MVKKSLIVGLTAIILSLCCGICFAAEDNNTSTNLGNEITESIDKTGQSMENMTDNVFSTNTVDSMKNGITNTMDNMRNGVTGTMDNMRNGMNTTTDNGIVNTTEGQAGDYNVTRTTAEATTTDFNTMSTTTWMWIILAVAAIIIIAAIWYYATQNND